MAIKRNRRFHAEVATSSMSDIMFFLLLFFIIVSTMANPNVIKLTLPKAENHTQTSKQPISISVTEDKRFFINKQEVNPEELEANLMAQVGTNKDQTVVVRIPYNLQVQDLVNVLQIGVKNNLRFVLQTSR